MDHVFLRSNLDPGVRRERDLFTYVIFGRFPISFGVFVVSRAGCQNYLYFSQLSSGLCELPTSILNFRSQPSDPQRLLSVPSSIELQSESIELVVSKCSRSSPTPIETVSAGASANANLESHLQILF